MNHFKEPKSTQLKVSFPLAKVNIYRRSLGESGGPVTILGFKRDIYVPLGIDAYPTPLQLSLIVRGRAHIT